MVDLTDMKHANSNENDCVEDDRIELMSGRITDEMESTEREILWGNAISM
jgi:hypothetical protein